MSSRYAVIGNPIQQSKSPLIHGMFAQPTGQDTEYTLLEAPPGRFAGAVDNMVEDFAGLKIRVIPNPINLDWVKTLDANPTPIAFPEVYGALESKALDGQENPFSVIQANKINEVQRYLTVTNHVYNPQSVIISKKFWDTLSGDERKLLGDAAVEAGKSRRLAARDAAGAALETQEGRHAGQRIASG